MNNERESTFYQDSHHTIEPQVSIAQTMLLLKFRNIKIQNCWKEAIKETTTCCGRL